MSARIPIPSLPGHCQTLQGAEQGDEQPPSPLGCSISIPTPKHGNANASGVYTQMRGCLQTAHVPVIQPSANVISIGLKITKTTTNHQNNSTAATTARAFLWNAWSGRHREQEGLGGGGIEGRLVCCQCWELRNAKSIPYAKEILKPRQHFLSFLIDNKDMEKERGRLREPGIFFFYKQQPNQMALIREITHPRSPHTPRQRNGSVHI